MSLNEEQVLALAPDDAAAKAGKALAAPAKWVSAGSSGRAVWGECQGSGAKPYQTIADSAALGFKCSCPSRKFPCKHGLGLLLYYIRSNSAFTETGEPDWVSAWLDKRAEKSTVARAEKPVDAAAQAKRVAARETKVSAGLEELQLWLKDIVRSGLVQLPEKHAKFFDEAARRLVDAQAPGLAREVRALGNTSFYTDGWQTPALEIIARLYLATTAYSGLARQDEAIAEDVRSFIGFTRPAEALQQLEGITDTWMVLGKRVEEDGPVTTEQYWLAGAASGRPALVLQFIARGAQPTLSLTSGQCFKGDLVYYPSVSPLRAAIRSQVAVSGLPALPSLKNWEEVTALESNTFERTPFAGKQASVMAAARPVQLASGSWVIEDTDGAWMQLSPQFGDTWKWAGMSGGDYLPTAVLGAASIYEPLGVWHNSRYTNLS